MEDRTYESFAGTRKVRLEFPKINLRNFHGHVKMYVQNLNELNETQIINDSDNSDNSEISFFTANDSVQEY